MRKPHATTTVAFIICAVGILITVKGWTGTAGATATWFAIAAAIYGAGIAARNLKHAQDTARATELDRQANQVITHRRNAIRAVGEYAQLVDSLEPMVDTLESTMNESFYRIVNQMGADKLPAFDTLEAIRAQLYGPIYQNYLLAYSEIKETPLAEQFNQLYVVVLSMSERVNKMISDLKEQKADMAKIGELRVVLNHSSSTQAQIVDMIRAGEVPLDYNSVITELKTRGL